MNASHKIKHILLIASGKGGVGKSTVAVNLAVALAREGLACGLLDADLFGPSIPLSFGLEEQKSEVIRENDKETWIPLERFGVKLMSLGFFMQKEDPVIWRGPMATKAVTQLVNDTRWGELDFLVIDMPPGTSDISITLANLFPEAQSLIVITPQQLAVADGRKAIHMFQKNGIDIPILGIIENMSWFTPLAHPEEKYLIFGQGGAETLSKESNLPVIAQIPLVADVCEKGDKGLTIFSSKNKNITHIFEKLAEVVIQKTEDKNYA